ncbi:hypothetical protein ACFLYU_03055 [Candidatus Dependentiae bacterium]
MNAGKLTIASFLLLFTQVVKSGDVILVNLCKKESLTLAHMRGSKQLKKYYLECQEPKKSKKFKDEKIKKDQEKKCYEIIRDVKLKEKEGVLVKGNKWGRLPKKWHYEVLGLKKDVDYIIFFQNAKSGKLFGGDLDFDVLEVKSKKEKIIGKIKHIYGHIIPEVNDFAKLKYKDLKKDKFEIKKDLEKLESFGNTIKNLGVFAKYYKDLAKKINNLYGKIEGFLDPKKEIIKHEKKNPEIVALVTGIATGKIKFDWKVYFEQYNCSTLKKIIDITSVKMKKEKSKNAIAKMSQIVSRCNWAIAKKRKEIKKKK